jgi:aquaporin NIP
MRCAVAEAFGTFTLLFCGTGAIIINAQYGGSITHLGIALTFGLVVLAMIYALGDVSGAHMNPAVSIAFVVAGRFPISGLLTYLPAQAVGAFLASFSLKLMFPEHPNLGATLPAGAALQSGILEFILTMILMVVILGVSTGSKEKGVLAGIAIGSVIALEALFAGPVCGASMNPIRSIAPAVVSGVTDHLWLYIVAPILGAIFGVGIWQIIKPGEESA